LTKSKRTGNWKVKTVPLEGLKKKGYVDMSSLDNLDNTPEVERKNGKPNSTTTGNTTDTSGDIPKIVINDINKQE
jgi:hypothetical protein